MEYARTINLTSENCFIAGHFPGHPIAPAAAVLQMFMQALNEIGVSSTPLKIKEFKMLQELTPEGELSLLLHKKEDALLWQGVATRGDRVIAKMVCSL